MATPACGWEVDDIVRLLEADETVFSELQGVERQSAVEAGLTFGSAAGAEALRAALTSERVPEAMRAATEHLKVDGATLNVRFRPTEEVALTPRGDDHRAACVHTD